MKEYGTKRKINKYRVLRGMLIFPVIAGIFLALAHHETAYALTPRVMVSDYRVEEEHVTAGKPFALVLNLKNTATKSKVYNVKVSITSENGEFLPREGAGTAYLEKIEAGEEPEVSFAMQATDGLEEKSYKLSIKTEYEDGNGSPYDVTDTIYLPVSLEQRILVSDLYLAKTELMLGDTVEVSAAVNNLGAGSLYNVRAHVEGDNLVPQESFVGTVAAGKSGTIDLLTKTNAVSAVGDKNKLVVTYEDKDGKLFTVEQEIVGFSVAKPVYDDLQMVKEAPKTGIIIKRILIGLGIALVLAFLIWIIWMRIKKRKKMLDEI